MKRVGVLVPPANPTVEPELAALLPSAAIMHVARLPVVAGDLRSRLAHYRECMGETSRGFGELKLDALLCGVTGAMYPVGAEEDDALCKSLASAARAHAITASLAVVGALRALECKSLTLISPYPDWLTRESVSYWQSAGFSVARIESLSETFRAYEMTEAEVKSGLETLCNPPGDVVLIAGTGLATLGAIGEGREKFRLPLLSSNICSAWWISRALGLPASEKLRALAPALAATLNQ